MTEKLSNEVPISSCKTTTQQGEGLLRRLKGVEKTTNLTPIAMDDGKGYAA